MGFIMSAEGVLVQVTLAAHRANELHVAAVHCSTGDCNEQRVGGLNTTGCGRSGVPLAKAGAVQSSSSHVLVEI